MSEKSGADRKEDRAEATKVAPASRQAPGQRPGVEGETAAPSAEEQPLEERTAEAAPGEDEIGGPKGPEPTRFGDWERKGRCIDF